MPTRYPQVQIVDAPTADANVLYDFQDDTSPTSKATLRADDWDFGRLNLLGDPDAVGVDWALQQISFAQQITGTKAEAGARRQAMSRALLRRRFWVMFKLDADSTPVWWHGYRTPPGALSLDHVYVDDLPRADLWLITGTIDIDPFSFAARVTQPTQAVGNNPANDATVPSSGYALPTIEGDSPTRLRLALASNAGSTFAQTWLTTLIASSRANPVIRVPIGTGDAFTAGTGTAAGATNTQAVGGSSRAVSMAAGATIAVRLVGPLPASGSTPRGRYMVYLRCAGKLTSTDGGFAVTMQLLSRSTLTVVDTPLAGLRTVEFTSVASAAQFFQYVPLGEISIGEDIPADMTAPTQRTIALSIGAGLLGSSFASTVTLDEFILVPVSGPDIASVTSLTTTVVGVGAKTATPLIIDGDDETAWMGGGQEPSSYRVTCAGGFPEADPAAAFNVLLVLPLNDVPGLSEAAGTTRIAGLAATAAADVSYQPRSSWIGDGAT